MAIYYKSKYSGKEIDEKLDKVDEILISGNPTPIDYGDTTYSAVLKGEYQGNKNQAISQTSMAIGAGNIAGLKGWYYSAIDFTNKKITLSDKPTYILVGTTLVNGGWSSGTPNIKVGDKISIVNNSKYDYCGEVASISGNVIGLKDGLPFSSLVVDKGAASAVIAGNISDGYSIYIPDRPDAGIIDFGGGAFAEGGLGSKASNICAHAEGLTTHAYGQYSHAEGRETKSGYAAHAEGNSTRASGNASHAEGYNTEANAHQSHAEGWLTFVGEKARAGHAEGYNTYVGGTEKELVEGTDVSAGAYSHAEGNSTQAIGCNSHTEGLKTIATDSGAHAEGNSTRATGNASHAEGKFAIAEGYASHAEGLSTIAKGYASHAEGCNSQALASQSHAEGESCIANGQRSHAEGFNTKTNNQAEHACGKYNKSTQSTDTAQATAWSIGGGTSSVRSNLAEIKQNGDFFIKGIATSLQDYISSLETRIKTLEGK